MGRERVERGRGAGEPLVEFVVPEDKNRLQVTRATRRPPERGNRVPMGHHHPGAGVGIEVLDGVGLELRVRHDDGRADLERAEQRSHEPWPVRKGDHDALLGLDAALGEYVAEPIRQRLDLPVGERPRVGEHRRPLALPFTHAGVGLELRVRHDDGRADLERAEQRSHEPWPVRKGDHDALLGLDAALGEYVAEPIRQRLDLPVGERPRVGEHRRPLALPFTHAGVEEVVGDVELLGRLEAHRDRYRPWTAGGQPPRPVRYSHPMAVLDLAHLTWEEVRDLDRTKTVAIEAAVTQIRRADGARIVFPDVTKKPWAVRLTEEFRSGACHAGQYESSIVLAARPELVRETVRRSLPANPRSLSGAIRAGQTNFEQAGGPRAYFGSPAEARADEGARTIEVLGAILEEAVLAELGQ